MNNKTDIEEDIKILKNITKQDFSNPMGWTGYYDSELKELQQAIENILADREEWKNKAEWFKRLCNKNEETSKQLKDKANKYDSLVEKIKEKIELHKDYLFNQAVTSNPTLDAHFREKERYVISVFQELLDTEKEK